jgi:hypothetical protein
MFVMKSFKNLMVAGSLALGVLSTSTDKAEATTVSAIGDSFNVDYAYETLVATLTWTVTNIDGNRWSFSVLIDNNSLASPDTNSNRITSFGFTTDPNATDLTVSTSGWDGTTTGTVGPHATFGIEACVHVGQACPGGGNGGVFAGTSPTINISFDYGPGPLTFTAFTTRWQSISVTDPNNPSGRPATSLVIGPSIVPLPAAGFLLIGALGGLAVLRRRRNLV